LTKLLLSNNQLFGIIPKSNPWLTFDANGNKDLINATTSNTSPKSAKGKSVTAALVIGFAVALFAVGVVIGVAISISRRYYRVNDEQSQSAEDPPPPRVLQGNLLTANAIHRSNIDFTKAMEAVVDPSNITPKTKLLHVKNTLWSDMLFASQIFFLIIIIIIFLKPGSGPGLTGLPDPGYPGCPGPVPVPGFGQ